MIPDSWLTDGKRLAGTVDLQESAKDLWREVPEKLPFYGLSPN